VRPPKRALEKENVVKKRIARAKAALGMLITLNQLLQQQLLIHQSNINDFDYKIRLVLRDIRCTKERMI